MLYRVNNKRRYCIDDTLREKSVGYVVNIECTGEVLEQVGVIQQAFVKRFGDAVYVPQGGDLHITVADFLTTLADYGGQEDAIFDQHKKTYDAAITESLSGISPFSLRFHQLELFEPCAIMRGPVTSELQKIRTNIMERVELLEATKVPPQISHSSILSFRTPVPFDEAKKLLGEFQIDARQEVKKLRFIRETKVRHQEYEVLKVYSLGAE